MRKIFLPLSLMMSVPMASCATTQTASVRLTADKAYLGTIALFVSFQQSALAGIHSGVITGETKAKVLDLLANGHVIETRLYVSKSVADIILLTGVVSDLSTLGIKGN